ncbi:MAG: tyrosine-type recombinase/integrase [Actinomycetota bacterium]|nr:tyrosine-type recombinase/integrase [Actinomycetota bacterium]
MSALETHVAAYLRLRRTLGYDLEETGRLLHRFAAELDTAGVTHVTTQVAVRWALEPRVSAPSSVPATRYRSVRGFARYMAGIDPETEIPPAGLIRRPRTRRSPFIYTDEDVLALLDQARQSIPQPLRAATMHTLIGLLAASGLRVGEALRLDRGDVDWSEGVLHIRQSKFRKSRLVPLSPSVLEELERYAHLRDRLRPALTCESFFVSLRGTRVIHECVWKTFRTLCDDAGVGAGSSVRPTIHDLRHRFAVRALLSWYQQEVDVQPRLAWLATYLGHRDPVSSYWYLSAAPELLAQAARRLDTTGTVRR